MKEQKTTESFLDETYEVPSSGGNYMKIQKGENKIRILSKPILGYEDWTPEKKPVRFRMNEKPIKPLVAGKAVKHFWAFIVWNYQEEKIQILQITQSTIQKAIAALSKDEDWGSPFGYDIKISRKGDGMETEYAINPVPHKKIAASIEEALVAKGVINLDALFNGEDPFAPVETHEPVEPLPF